MFCDIDGTICTQCVDYSQAKPFPEKIKIINNYYDLGNTVIYWTARGSGTGTDWREVTEKQLKEWGVKYSELRFGKPIYDLFIDDRSFKSAYELLLM